MTVFLAGDSWASMDVYQDIGAVNIGQGGSSTQYWRDYLDNFTNAGGRLNQGDVVILSSGGVDFLNHTPRDITYNNLKYISQVLTSQGVVVELVGVPNVSSLSELVGPIKMDPLYNRIASEVPNVVISTAMMDTIQHPEYLDASGFHLNQQGYIKYNQILQDDFFVNQAFQGYNKGKLKPIVYDNHQMVLDEQHHAVMVSDEPYWNKKSATDISNYVTIAHQYGLRAGVAITPVSWDRYGGDATTEQLMSIVQQSDFVVIDPFIGVGLTEQQLLEFSHIASDYVHSLGKQIYAEVPTYANPTLVQETIHFENTLLETVDFDGVYKVSATDFPDIPDSWDLVGNMYQHQYNWMF